MTQVTARVRGHGGQRAEVGRVREARERGAVRGEGVRRALGRGGARACGGRQLVHDVTKNGEPAVRELGELRTLYADALGVEIGRLVEFSEGSNYSPPQPMMFARAEAMDSSTPISGGQIEVSVTVTGVYAIEN